MEIIDTLSFNISIVNLEVDLVIRNNVKEMWRNRTKDVLWKRIKWFNELGEYKNRVNYRNKDIIILIIYMSNKWIP